MVGSGNLALGKDLDSSTTATTQIEYVGQVFFVSFSSCAFFLCFQGNMQEAWAGVYVFGALRGSSGHTLDDKYISFSSSSLLLLPLSFPDTR